MFAGTYVPSNIEYPHVNGEKHHTTGFAFDNPYDQSGGKQFIQEINLKFKNQSKIKLSFLNLKYH